MSAKIAEKYPVVKVNENKITTNSKNLADVFGKNHKDVLRAIENLDTPEEFNRRNFAPISTKDRYGRPQPMIEMTRDGFTILVMGFTGPKAMKFKLAYIEAFNKMEAELKSTPLPAVLDTEILKTLLATSQAVEALHGKLAIVSTVADSLAHLSDLARTMTLSVQSLSNLSRLEESVRQPVESFRHLYEKRTEQDYQRFIAHGLTQDRIEATLQTVKRSLSDIEKRLDDEEQSRGGILGYLETYLPKLEAENIRNTPNITPDNDPEKFLKESCTVDAFASVELTFLYKVYKAWCLSRFSPSLSPVLFWDTLRDRLPQHVSTEIRKNKRVLTGIKPCSDKLANGNQEVRP